MLEYSYKEMITYLKEESSINKTVTGKLLDKGL